MFRYAGSLLYSSSLAINMLMALIILFIPLYGLREGLSMSHIGFLVSLPGFVQVVFRPITGACCDRMGEKSTQLMTFIAALIAGLAFWQGNSVAGLAVGQLFMGFSRSFYWTSSQSYASRIPNCQPERTLGHLSASVNLGRMSGLLLGGILIQTWGYELTFAMVAFLAAAGLAGTLLLPALPRKEECRSFLDSFKGISNIINYKPLQLAAIASFTGGTLMSLVDSFIPVWLSGLGYAEAMIGVIMVVRGVGSLASSLNFSRLSRILSHNTLFSLGLFGSGLLFVVLPYIKTMLLIVPLLLLIGVMANITAVLYTVMGTSYSTEDKRGMSLAIVGMGWSLAYLVMPSAFGYLIEVMSLRFAFLTLGLLGIGCGLLVKPLFAFFLGAASTNGDAALEPQR